MKATRTIGMLAIFSLTILASGASADALKVDQIMKNLLASDPFGLSGAEFTARMTLTDKDGSKRELVYSGKSARYDPPLAKGIVRFSAPPDLAGAAFLQVQKKDGDDERVLFLPELKRSRRIAGSLRSSSFMGTDFSFADLDRRDLRDGSTALKGSEAVGKLPCYVVEVKTPDGDSGYSRAELWIREDSFLPVRMKMYDRSGVLLKMFEALEVKRVSGAWFISKSRMTNVQQKHSTDMTLEKIALNTKYNEDEFSVRALEKP